MKWNDLVCLKICLIDLDRCAWAFSNRFLNTLLWSEIILEFNSYCQYFLIYYLWFTFYLLLIICCFWFGCSNWFHGFIILTLFPMCYVAKLAQTQGYWFTCKEKVQGSYFDAKHWLWLRQEDPPLSA
jgi:hypothetical protein